MLLTRRAFKNVTVEWEGKDENGQSAIGTRCFGKSLHLTCCQVSASAFRPAGKVHAECRVRRQPPVTHGEPENSRQDADEVPDVTR